MAKPRAGKQSLKKSGRFGSTQARRRSLSQQFRHSLIEQLERRDLFVASLSISNALAVEGASAVFSVTLSEAASQEVTVDYVTVAGSAGSTQDFLAQSGTLTFQPNELTKTISIATVNDNAGELREAFSVQLSNPQRTSITTAAGDGMIDDDDLVPTRPGNGTITVPTGVTLGGDGSTTSDIIVNSGGTLAPGGTPGTLTTTGSTTLESGATYSVELVNTTHDLLVTNGITLNGATLNVTSNVNLGAGTAFLLIDNTSANPIVGTFAGLPEGKGFFINGYQYFITYEYGVDGNDVAITRNQMVDAVSDQFGPILANTILTANTYPTDIDPDGDARSTLIVQPPNGQVFMDPATGSFVYTPDSNFIGSDTFTYRLSDGEFNDTATVTIVVAAVFLDGNGIVQVSGTTSGDNIIVQSGSVRYNSTTYPLSASKVVVHGNGGNDTISVTASNITVEFYGDDGDDYLSGGSLNDILAGGAGTDRLQGNGGDDRLYGGGGSDVAVTGGAGNDYLSGDGYLDASGVEQQAIDAGKDTLSGDAGDDEIHGGAGMDTLLGGIGNDYLRGGDDGDSVDGGDGNDILFGEAGGDKLYGRAGNDVLIGGEGLDTPLGDTGQDLVYGGDVDSALAAGGVLLQTLANQWFVSATQATAISGFGSHTIDDTVSDTLNGEADDDWYLLFDKDLITSTERFPGNRTSAISPFGINDVSVIEGDVAQFTVSLPVAATQTLTLSYQTSSLSATSGADFTATSGTLTFDIGDTTKTITVPTNTDLVEESDETFRVTLANAIYNIFTDNVGIATILDATNVTPVAVNDNATGNANAAIIGNLLSNDTDTDLPGDSLSVAKINGTTLVSGATITLPSGAELTVNSNGTFSYYPLPATQFQTLAAGQSDFDSFTYTVRDSQNAESTGTVSLEIDGVNDAPTVLDPFVELPVDEDAANSVLILAAHFTDVDAGDTLTYSIVSNTQTSLFDSVTIDSLTQELTLVYAPHAYGSAIVTIRATDPAGSYVDAPLSITIAPINDAPLADDDTFTTSEDTDLTAGNVLTNDSDLEGDALTAELVTGPAHGSLTLNTDGTFTYVPVADFHGEDSFTYQAHDGDLLGNIATVTITVESVNDAPIANDDSYETGEGTALNIALASGLLASDTDVDADDALAVVEINGASAAVGTAITLASGALLTVSSDGSFQYDPSASRQLRALSTGETFDDSFAYTLRDADGAAATATVSITVQGLTGAGAVYFAEDALPVEIASLRNFFAEVFGVSGGPALSFTLDSTNDLTGGLFTAALVAGVLTITPQPNAHGIGQLLLQAFDGEVTATTLLDIHIASINDAPHFVSNIDDQSTTEDGTVTAIDLAGYFADVDLDKLTLTAISSDLDLATPTITNGSLGITLVANAYGSAIITVRATDPSGAFTESSFQLTVTAVNDSPLVANPLANISLPHSSADQTFDLATVFADRDGDTLAFTASSSNAAVGTVSVANGVLTFHFVAGETGETNITVRVTDPSGAYVEDHFLITATGLPYVSNLHLVNDTGVSASDRVTSDPTLTGTVLDDFQNGTVRIEFDHQGDGVADGYVDVAESGDSFSYDPRSADPVFTAVKGAIDLRFRVVAKDDQSAEFYTSSWNNFSFTIHQPKLEIAWEDHELYSGSGAIDYGDTDLGHSKLVTIALSNVGEVDLLLDVNATVLPVGFSFVNSLPSSIAVGDTVNVGVRLDGSALGTARGTLQIASNDPTMPAFTVLLVGQVVQYTSNLQLATDTGANNTDRITYDPTLTGTVVGSLSGATPEVQFDLNGDGTSDATATLDGNQSLTYDPRVTDSSITTQTGVLGLSYRIVARDSSNAVVHTGDWQVFTMSLVPNPTLGAVRVDGFGLLKDTNSNTDNVTLNPILTGRLLGNLAGGSARVEFDHDSEDAIASVDGVASVSASGDRFIYDPRISEPGFGAAPWGERHIAYRLIHLDDEGTTVAVGDWTSFDFELLEPSPQQYLSGLSLQEDNGSSSWDLVTSNPTVGGYVSMGSQGYASVEFDLDGDDSPDESILTSDTGNFSYRVNTASEGIVTISARTAEWSLDAATMVYGNWVDFTFTLAPKLAPTVASITLAHDVGESTTDNRSTDPTIKGNLTGEPEQTAGMQIEIDENGDGQVDGETRTDGSGKFEYLPRLLNSGYVTVRARSVVATDSGESPGSWYSFSFTYDAVAAPPIQAIKLQQDTGFSNSDGITTNPALLGKLALGANDGMTEVQFDHNGDNVIDGTAYSDGSGVFRYTPIGLATGVHTILARTQVWDDVKQDYRQSSWTSVPFTLEATTNQVVTISTLELLNDTGTSATDKLTSDSTIIGKLTNSDGSVSRLTVQIDRNNDGTADETIVTETNGSFEYSPASVSSGSNTIQFRAREFDAATEQFVYSSWTTFTFDYAPASNLTATIASLVLQSDTGSSQSDGITANPLVTGQIANDGALASIRLEFDHNNDEVVDGSTFTSSDGSFAYLPTNLAYGSIGLRARTVEWNPATGSYLTGSWTTLSFTYQQQSNAAPLLVQLGLKNDTGSSATDLITTDGTLQGRVVNESSLGGITIEVDWNNNGTVDQVATTDSLGRFVVAPVGLATGSHTVKARTRETDNATLQSFVSGWSTFSFTLQASSLPSIGIGQVALVEDTGSSNSDKVTTNATLTGVATGISDFENLTIEFDHDNDNVIDGTATVDGEGEFTYLPANLPNGPHTLRLRAKYYSGSGAPQVGNWQSFTLTLEAIADTAFRISQLQLQSDTGASNSDRATANATVSGQLVNIPGSLGTKVEIDTNNDGVVDATVNASGNSFSYDPAPSSNGLVSLRVRAIADDATFQEQSTAWSTVQFIFSTNPDGTEAQDWAAELAAHSDGLTDADGDYDTAIRQADVAYRTARDGANSAYETQLGSSRSAYEAALQAADSAYQNSLTSQSQNYTTAIEAARIAFETALGSYSGATNTYDFQDFFWPEQAPDANGLVIPDNATQTKPPALPTYTGEFFDYLTMPTFRQASDLARTVYNATLKSAEDALQQGIADADSARKSAIQAATLIRTTAISNAKEAYRLGVKISEADQQKLTDAKADHDQRVQEAHERFATTDAQVQADYNARYEVLDSARLKNMTELDRRYNDETASIVSIFNAFVASGTHSSSEIAAAATQRDSDIQAAARKKAEQVAKTALDYDIAVADLQEGTAKNKHQATLERDTTINASLETLATKQAEYDGTKRSLSINADNTFNKSISAADKDFADSVAEAENDYADTVAGLTRDRDIAAATAFQIQSYASSNAEVLAWQAINLLAGTPYTNFQLALSQHEAAYLQNTADAALVRDTAIAGETYFSTRLDAHSVRTQTEAVSAAQKTQTDARSEALKEYRLASSASEQTRAVKNAELLRIEKDVFSTQDANNLKDYLLAHYSGNKAVYRIEYAERMALAADPSAESDYFAFHYPFTWRREEAIFARDLGTFAAYDIPVFKKNEAVKEYRHDYVEEEYRHGTVEADARAVYEGQIATADENYAAATASEALRFTRDVAINAAELSQTLAVHDRAYALAFNNETFAKVDADAGAEETFVDVVTNNYVQAVETWKGTASTPWQTYQFAIAEAYKQSEQSRVAARRDYLVDVADFTKQHDDTAAQDSYAHRQEIANASISREEDLAEKQLDAITEIANLKKDSAQARAAAIKLHDKAILAENATYEKQLATEEQARRDALYNRHYYTASNGYYYGDLGTAWQQQKWYDSRRDMYYLSPGSTQWEAAYAQQLDLRELMFDRDAARVEFKRVADAQSARDFNQHVADARASWTIDTSAIKITLAAELKDQEIELAAGIREKTLVLLDELAEIRVTAEQEIAAADKALSDAQAQNDFALESDIASEDRAQRTSGSAHNSVLRDAESTSRQDYLVGLHQQHADSLETIKNSATGATLVLANYQWQMAEAALAQAQAHRLAEATYQTALTTAQSAEVVRLNNAESVYQLTVGGASTGYNIASSRASIDFGTSESIATLQSGRDAAKANAHLTSDNATAEANHRYQLALAERDKVDDLAASDQTWVTERVAAQWALESIPRVYVFPYFVNVEPIDPATIALHDTALANADAAHTTRNQQIAEQYDLDQANAALVRATALGAAIVTHATALGDAGIALSGKLNAADTAYQATISPAEQTRATAVRSAQTTYDTALAASARLSQVATGDANLARLAAHGIAMVDLATAQATAPANYFRDDAQYTVDTIYAGFGGQPLSNFSVDELHPYAAALAKRDWFAAMASTSLGVSSFITYATAVAQAQATYDGSVAAQQQASTLAEMDASAALAALLAALANTRDGQDAQSQDAYDTELTTLQNTRRGSLYEADKARLIAYAESNRDIAVAQANADRDYYQVIVDAEIAFTELELTSLSTTKSEVRALAAKAGAIALADTDLQWVASTAAAEGGYSLSAANKTNSLDSSLVDHQRSYATATASTQRSATNASAARINASDTTGIAAVATRNTATANAWVAFQNAGYESQVDAVDNFVTLLSGSPWAYYIVAHSQAAEAWWDDVSDDYLTRVNGRNSEQLAAVQAINSARTDATAASATAEYQRQLTTSNTIATRGTASFDETLAFSTAMINANVAYQFSYATSQRDLAAENAHIKMRESLGADSAELNSLQTAAQVNLQNATRLARTTRAIAEADANGDYRIADAAHDLTQATAMLSSETTYITDSSVAQTQFATAQSTAYYNQTIAMATNDADYLQDLADSRQAIVSTLSTTFAQPVDISPWADKEAELIDAERDLVYADAAERLTAVTAEAAAIRDQAVSEAETNAALEIGKIMAPATFAVARATAQVVWANVKALGDNALATAGMFTPTLPPIPSLRDLSSLPAIAPAATDHYFSVNDPTQEPYARLLQGNFLGVNSSDLANPLIHQLAGDQLLEALKYPSDPHQDDAAYLFQIDRQVREYASQAWGQVQNINFDPRQLGMELGAQLAGLSQRAVLTGATTVEEATGYFSGTVEVSSQGNDPFLPNGKSGGSNPFQRIADRFTNPAAFQEIANGIWIGFVDGFKGTVELITSAGSLLYSASKYLIVSPISGGRLGASAGAWWMGRGEPLEQEMNALRDFSGKVYGGAEYLYDNSGKIVANAALKIAAIQNKIQLVYAQMEKFINQHGDDLVEGIVNRDVPTLIRIRQDVPDELQKAVEATIQVADWLINTVADQITPENLGYITGQVLYEFAEDAAISAAVGTVSVLTAGAGTVTTGPALSFKILKITNMLRKIANKAGITDNVISIVAKRLDELLALGEDFLKQFKHVDNAVDAGKQADNVADASKSFHGLPILQPTGCFAAGTLVWVSALPELDIFSAATAEVLDELYGLPTLICQTLEATETTCAIEEVPLGARVVSRNPLRDDYDDSLPEPDEATWRLIRLEVAHRDGGVVEIEWLRPVEWLEAYNLSLGARVATTLPEIGVQAEALVTALEPCPPLAAGDGAVVIGRYVTRQVASVARVLFLNGEELVGTIDHPVWSADRYDWVGLGALTPGEHVRSRDGLLAVLSVTILEQPQPVYNIEVHGEHVYEVTESGILVHNATDCWEEFQALKARQAKHEVLSNIETSRLAELQAAFESGGIVRNRIVDSIPSVRDGKFNRWFNSLSADQLDELWKNPQLRDALEDRLRHPGGLHEWHVISRTPTFRRWGLTADQIKDMRTLIEDTQFVNPVGKHGRKGSTAAHNELLAIVDSSPNYQTFVRRLQNWANYRLKGGAYALPPGLRPQDFNMREEGFVSLWLGIAQSSDALDQYVALTYTDGGELIPSQFMKDFVLPRWDEACREAEYLGRMCDSVTEVLSGFSYDAQLIEQYKQILGESLAFPVNAAVLLYNFNLQNPTVMKSAGTVKLRFVGVVRYLP